MITSTLPTSPMKSVRPLMIDDRCFEDEFAEITKRTDAIRSSWSQSEKARRLKQTQRRWAVLQRMIERAA